MKPLAVGDARAAPSVVTESDLQEGLRALGIDDGSLVLVHASLSAFGVIPGGEQTLIRALWSAVGVEGTIVMPTQSWQLCDPDFLDDPALDPAERAAVREALPVYDELLTPTRSMGRVAELFRLQPGTRRSPHPHRSFAAAGPLSREITRVHEPDSPFGESSPLARLYDADALVLLLGVGFDKCTSLHLAEERAAEGHPRKMVRNGAPTGVAGAREWTSWEEPVVDDSDFAAIGTVFEGAGHVRSLTVGDAECRALSMVEFVDFAVENLHDRRSF